MSKLSKESKCDKKLHSTSPATATAILEILSSWCVCVCVIYMIPSAHRSTSHFQHDIDEAGVILKPLRVNETASEARVCELLAQVAVGAARQHASMGPQCCHGWSSSQEQAAALKEDGVYE